MREEGLLLLESVDETIRIGEEAGLPSQITHHKVVGAPMWGSSVKTLEMVDAARARGVDVTIDQYPYTASSTSLSILFPAWSLEGERPDQLARMRDPTQRARIKSAIVRNLEDDRGGGDPKNVVVSRCEWDPSLQGKSLADILRDQNRPVTIDEAAELALELQEKGGFSGIFHAMAETRMCAASSFIPIRWSPRMAVSLRPAKAFPIREIMGPSPECSATMRVTKASCPLLKPCAR